MSREGDWMCNACHHLNFKRRDSCRQCRCPRYASPADASSYETNRTEDVLAGDWYCSAMNCGLHNYASRTICYRCGSPKDNSFFGVEVGAADSTAAPPGWKTGDWICTRQGCSVHNYASRVECFKCGTPRDLGKQ